MAIAVLAAFTLIVAPATSATAGEPETARAAVTAPLQASLWNGAPVTAPRHVGRRPVELGVRFTVDRSGEATGIRFYKARGERGRHVATLWDAQGQVVARAQFAGETREGWQTARFRTPVALRAGATYVASYHSKHGTFVAQKGGFANPVVSGPLTAPADRNGVYAYGNRPRYPAFSNPAKVNYFVDVLFTYTPGPGPTPTVTPTPTKSPTPTSSPTASPTPTKSPTPTDPPPSTGKFPDASNTGPTISTFKKIKGGVVKENGAVFDGVEVSDGFDIYANNVTIRNCKIITDGYWGIQLRAGYTNLTVENCEIGSNGKTRLETGVWSDGSGTMTVRKNDIHHTSNAAIMATTGVIEDNYIHDLWEANPGDHTDGIQSNGTKGASNLVINHNTVVNPENQTSAIILSPVFGPIHDVVITNNLLAGGGYCLYGGAKHIDHPYSPYNVVIKNNVFSKRVFSKCGYYGPSAHFDSKAFGNQWVNNRWEDSSKAIEVG